MRPDGGTKEPAKVAGGGSVGDPNGGRGGRLWTSAEDGEEEGAILEESKRT